MPPKKLSPIIEEHPSTMLPTCASYFATLSVNMAQVTKDQAHIAEKIWGNGKTGMDEQLSENTRAITSILSALDKAARVRELEAQTLATERKVTLERQEEEAKEKINKEEQLEQEKLEKEAERNADIKKWWLGIGAAILLAIIAIIRDYTTQAAIMTLLKK